MFWVIVEEQYVTVTYKYKYNAKRYSSSMFAWSAYLFANDVADGTCCLLECCALADVSECPDLLSAGCWRAAKNIMSTECVLASTFSSNLLQKLSNRNPYFAQWVRGALGRCVTS